MSITADTSLPLSGAWTSTGLGLPVASGNAIGVFEAALRAVRSGEQVVLSLVLETEGSTYAGMGAMALFGHRTRAGWLSGGCLEPAIERRAADAGASGRLDWMEIDTRDDESLLTGSATGCRGRLRIALLPLHRLAGIDAMLEAWLEGHRHACFSVATDGRIEAATPALHRCWQLDAMPVEWTSPRQRWSVRVLRPPEVLILGAGPETPALVPLLRELGWRVHVAERRPRWRDDPALAGSMIDATPAQSLSRAAHVDAALVMHHNFELDREALEMLAASPVPFIGLLGPSRRQEDLFTLLTPAQRKVLQPRLRSPVGIDLGGRGPETIALSIAAQLQAWRHGA